MQLGLFTMLVTAFLVTAFWEAEWLTPFKLMVVLVHEIWHGLCTMLAGGQVSTIAIQWDGAGETNVNGLTSLPGFALSVSAGYLGSTFSGALLLRTALQARYERAVLIGFAILLAYFALLFTELFSLAFNTATGWAAAFVVVAFASTWARRLVLAGVGTGMLWYSLYDMFDFTGQTLATDAGILARFLQKQGFNGDVVTLSYSISAIWVTIMIAGSALLLRSALRHLPAAAPAPAAPPVPIQPDPLAASAFHLPDLAGLEGLDSQGGPHRS